MIPLALFLLSTARFSGSAGFVFPNNNMARNLLGTVYTGTLMYAPWMKSGFYIGFTGNVAFKTGEPFHNDYMQDPVLHTAFSSFGLGISLWSQLTEYGAAGISVGLNSATFSYPEASENSSIILVTRKRIQPGIELYGIITPFSVKRLHGGLMFGVHLNGQENHDYYQPDYEMDMGIFGFFLRAHIGRW